MSQKYNITSKINKKLSSTKEDDDDETKNEAKTMSTEKESDSLKQKSLDQVLEDLNNIKDEYLLKDKIEAPEELSLNKIEVPNKTEDELYKIAKESLSQKYKTDKSNLTNTFETKINNLINKKDEYSKASETKSNSVEDYYKQAINETEEQALKRGLARSSIVIEQIASLNKDKASELINIMNDLQLKISDNSKEIFSLEEERDVALNNLDIAYAIELNQKLDEIKTKYDKSVQDAIEFNNNVEKLKAEYQLDLDKQKLDKQNTITKMEKEYKVDYVSDQIKSAQFEYLKNYFDSLDKEYAISLFLTNKDLKSILGDNYSKMYKYLTNK